MTKKKSNVTRIESHIKNMMKANNTNGKNVKKAYIKPRVRTKVNSLSSILSKCKLNPVNDRKKSANKTRVQKIVNGMKENTLRKQKRNNDLRLRTAIKMLEKM